MCFDYIEDNVNVDPEVLVDEDVPEAADLRPGDLRVHIRDLRRQVVHGLADDLQVALDRILCHLHYACVSVECGGIPLAPLDGLESIIDALRWVAAHNVTASTSAEAETGRLSS